MGDTDIDSSAYVEVRTFESGHCDTVNALSFSPDGTYLASGGDDCSLLLWNVPRERLIFRVLFNGPVSCIAWHPIHADTLIVGCDDGRIVQMYDFTLVRLEQHDIRIGVRSEVHCLDYNARTHYLAIGIGNEVHVTREQARNTYTGDIILPAPPDSERPGDDETRLRAVSVHFIDDGQQIIVSYLVHGIICYDVQKCEQVWAIVPPDGLRIGSSALSSDQNFLIAYGFERGVHLYSLVSRKNNRFGSYELEQAPRTKHRVQVAFVQKNRGIVCGTTTGSVCVWYKESKEIFQKLHHADGVIQAVATADRGPFSYIATGSVEQGQATKIKLWRAKMKDDPRDAEPGVLAYPGVKLVQRFAASPVSGRIVHWGLVLLYNGVFWVGLGLALAWGYTHVPWRAVRQACGDLVFVASGLPNTNLGILEMTYDRTAYWLQGSSEWLCMKVITWLQVDPIAVADSLPSLPSTVTTLETFTLTVTRSAMETGG